MISFTVHLDQLRLPVFAKAEHDLTESLEHGTSEAFTPGLRHEHEVITKCIAAVKQLVNSHGKVIDAWYYSQYINQAARCSHGKVSNMRRA